ncbi:MAG: o-succinylbenzoate synthase [Acidobacteriota bacterium]
MKIERIELREIHLPLVRPFETSFGRTFDRNIILVKVYSDGLIGWGECTVGENPFYNHESTGSCWQVIRDFAGPMVLGKEIETPEQVPQLTRQIRGNKMARAAVECAIWDLEARRQHKPLWQLLGGTQEVINCGVSLGLEDSDAAMLEKVETEVSAGYQRIKIKIKPGRGLRNDQGFGAAIILNIVMSVDANSAYTLADTGSKNWTSSIWLMIEQPLSYDDIDHAALQPHQTDICLDESISAWTTRAQGVAAWLAASSTSNSVASAVTPKRARFKRIATNATFRFARRYARSPAIGRAHNIHDNHTAGVHAAGRRVGVQTLLSRPEDIIIPPVEVTPQGTILRPTGVGVWLRGKRKAN